MSNYTDDVPVRIGDRYQPSKIDLPTKVIQTLSKTTQDHVAFEDYTFDLEHTIVNKSTDWIAIKLREKTERQERVHLRELTRRRQLEEDQKSKLNQVSYDDLSDESSATTSESEEKDNLQEARHLSKEANIVTGNQPFSPMHFSNGSILIPTQVADLLPSINQKHRRYASNSSNKIDFSFFESDSSPFDHLEMKSMNEMEVLAQVLGSTDIDQHNSNVKAEIVDVNNDKYTTVSSSVQQHIEYPLHSNGQYVPCNNYANHATAYQPLHTTNFYYSTHGLDNNIPTTSNDSISDVDSKSKNVADLVQELNDQLNNAEKRRRNTQKVTTETTLKTSKYFAFIFIL